MAAVRADNKEPARTQLTRVLEADQRNETAWLWLSGIMPLHQGRALQAELRQKRKTPLLGEILVHQGYLEQEQLSKVLLQWQEGFEITFR